MRLLWMSKTTTDDHKDAIGKCLYFQIQIPDAVLELGPEAIIRCFENEWSEAMELMGPIVAEEVVYYMTQRRLRG